jgi:hypothetical protein
MGTLSSYFSLGVSICTAAATFFFWIVKARRERPHLTIYPADPQFAGYAQSSFSDPIKLNFEVKTIIANYSTLPNAVLGVQATVKMSDGTWREAETRIDPKTPLPLNIASMQTMKLELSLALVVPAVPEGQACKNTHETYAVYRDRFLAQPLQVKVELKTLGEKMFANVLRSARRAA